MAEPHTPRNTITTKLPWEILFLQILPRLPVKALPNAMCVCKKWYLYLKSGAFASTYHHHVVSNDDHQNHHKYLVVSTTQRHMHSIDCETPKDGLMVARNLPFFLPFRGNMSILTSLHGLLCIGTIQPQNPGEYYDLILWNPLTGDYKMLSEPKKGCYHKECYKISEADFQQRASKWTSRGSYWEQPSHILLNEKLNFLKQVDRGGTFIFSYSVMRFDTKTEKFTEISIPSFGNQMTNCLGFMVLGGRIHFCVAILIEEENYMTNRRYYEIIELWRMDGDGYWTKVLTYGPMSFFLWGRSILHWMRNGNLLIRHLDSVYLLDMKKHTKEMIFTCQSMDSKIPPTGKYVETTVSPNQRHVYV
ncbi:uncharacterized protein LOC128132883 [Lactuca sativa]|uniref:uncharacterized protein LOC111877432 n=1 Tax=Lactuca sativa TaxID=4236 RepID=UPI0022AFC570|nr:uncharacterized protein LOC111877432 [Lactuca sativa]XP_052625842.1 uncharacterized protein LOC128132883 [Lactuca sativa]